MKPIKVFNEKHFLKYKDKSVKIKPYDPKTKTIANIYINLTSELLKGLSCEIQIRGSTGFEIAGKGDIEIGVYTNSKSWIPVLKKLKQKFGRPENKERDYARFNHDDQGYEIEIIVLKGPEADQDKALHSYLKNDKTLLKKYEQLKKKYAYSRRQYQYQKHLFFNKLLEQIPDNY